MESYRDFEITPCEYGGVHYAPMWVDGSEPAPTATTVDDAKKEIDAYWTDKLQLTARVTTGNWLYFNITKFDNVSLAEKFLSKYGKDGGFIHYYRNGQPYYNAP
jgi:hypothetical protein